MRSCSGNQSNGKPGADVEIASTITPPPPPPPPSLILSSLTQLHAQTSPLYPSAGLSCQPLFFSFFLPLISVAQINLSLHVPAVCSHDTIYQSTALLE